MGGKFPPKNMEKIVPVGPFKPTRVVNKKQFFFKGWPQGQQILDFAH